MKRIVKLQIKLFQSDTYRAMLAKYGAPGALLIVRLQVMEQTDTLPDFTDERQLLLLATEIGSDASTVAEMLQTLQQWNGKDEQPKLPEQGQPEPSPTLKNHKSPKNLHRKLQRKKRHQNALHPPTNRQMEGDDVSRVTARQHQPADDKTRAGTTLVRGGQGHVVV